MIKLYPPTLGGPAREDNSELEEHIKVILSIFDAGKYRKKSKDCLALRQHNEDFNNDPRLNYLKRLFCKEHEPLDLELLKTDLRENKLCKLAKNLQLDADKRKIIYFDPNNKYACPQTFAFIEYVISSEEKKQDAAPFSARNLENVLI